MNKRLEKMFYLYKHRRSSLIKGGILGFVGFLLSPLSWWNDLLINLPVAYVFAYVTTFILQPFITFNLAAFIILIGIGYWLSNILGFWLLHLSVRELLKYKTHYWRDFAVSMIYTIIIIILAVIGFSQPFAEVIDLVPAWISK